MKLSENETAALLVLGASAEPLTGAAIAEGMKARGIEANPGGARQSASGLIRKGLAAKTFTDGQLGVEIGYGLTVDGFEAAKDLRSAS